MTNKEKDYLTNFEARESLLYGLYKIHKSTIVKTTIENQNSEYITFPNPEDQFFRPFVGGPNSSNQRLSHLLEILLKPFCEKVSNFNRDDLDFLNHVPDTVDEDTTLVTFDAVSLYTNIPTELGIEAVKFWTEKYPNLLHDRFPQEFAIQGLKRILENNTFNFGNHFLQTKGTAMGTNVAPTYATVTLGYLEYRLLQKVMAGFSGKN